MKIWKSDLQGLLEEVVGPLYLTAASENRGGQLPTSTFYVSVAGWNRENHICELRIQRPPVVSQIREEVHEECTANRKTFDEIKARLDALGREYRDGFISDAPMGGSL